MDFDDMLESIGVSVDDVARAMTGFSADDLDGIDEHQVGALIQRAAPGISPADLATITKTIANRTNGYETLLATAAAVKAAAQAQRPNSSITLYATNAGVSLAPNTPTALRPRKGGALQSEDFEFTSDMTFLALRSDPVDCTRGFSLVGGSVGFADDIANSFRSDVALSVFQPDIPMEDTPLASLVKRSPKSNVKFKAQVVLDAAGAQHFYGITVVYTEAGCAASYKKHWLDSFADMDFAKLAQGIRNSVSNRLVATPQGVSQFKRLAALVSRGPRVL